MRRLTPEQWAALRERVYMTLAAAGPLAVVYGIATAEEVSVWLGILGAAFGNGMAATTVRRQRRGGQLR